ncbi:hypothetical protein Pedsa_0118 [Pseudopedobacter saltans DSM 12145]|uniref:Hemerythrin-like domain-containing protein n=1 Tax=Pseudopedobacter saltans (strain ATCC 51119 / DSM 12145 / JCM 21818 / CCUG 39354 / LMG 10337 / NBRC 100064 / NCIMB 13643) TaxID=762903 RepID=F0SCW5_PSESL|nr:hemerythrin domain-containing protein [Pseudopedobacter saltans]ADY50704.1 hypothetical protein Pedsa_0118 [Pseudopedobacter saltans DSM 12145]
MKKAPIKRSEFLVQLSRDHHLTLLFCWKIKEGLKKDIPLILKDYVLFFWNEHMQKHFNQEEELLFARSSSSLCELVTQQHLQINGIISQIKDSDNPQKTIFQTLIDRVNQHIRLEEREVFPFLEKTLSKEELEKIGETLKNEKDDFADDYHVEFWKH